MFCRPRYEQGACQAIRSLIALCLAERGYHVEAAADGSQALAAIRHRPPELIILDMMLPVMDGAQITRLIRSDPRTRDVPIIVVSADPRAPDRLAGIEMNARLEKPFDLDELEAVVKTHLPN